MTTATNCTDAGDQRFHRVYLGLGASLGDRMANLRSALLLLSCDDLRVLRVSPVYQSPHMGLKAEDSERYPAHLNIVALCETRLDPYALLERTQAVETLGARQRTERWGPRTIDIDILDYLGVHADTPRLRLPHPGIAQRAFVARPLLDLDADYSLPGGQRLDAPQNRALIASQSLERLPEPVLL